MPQAPLRAILGIVLSLTVAAGLAGEPPLVYASNYPLAYFAERIAGERVRVVLPMPPGEDPAFWRPDAAAIAAMQGADLIVLNGAGYESWLRGVSLPRRTLVDTAAGFRDRFIPIQDAATHSHGSSGEHSHAGTAFTTWLDPTLAIEQARAVRDALARLLPGEGEGLDTGLASLEADLMQLDADIAAVVAGDPGRPLIASHPVYQYLARRYGLNLRSVQWEPDAVAPDAQWVAFGGSLGAHPARWMLWEGEPAAENRRQLERFGVGSAVFAPGGNRPETGDYLDLMGGNVAELRRVFDPELR